MRAATTFTIHNVFLFIFMLVVAPPGEGRPLDEMGVRIGAKRLSIGSQGDHACFIRADGNVLCWGNNANGQIGDGTSGNVRREPASTGITTAVSVAVGDNHSCALLSTGVVQCWGTNASGQLGVGAATTSSSVPVTVPGLSGVVSLAAGTGFTCARKSDGTVRCWGMNNAGQLGDDTVITPRFGPVMVANLTDATKIVAGATHTCALRGNGGVVCWGSNNQGQLGIGNFTDRDIPTEVVNLGEVSEIAAGLRFTCAVRSEGNASCWGDNDLGQLGRNATSNNSNVPVAVEGSGFFVAIVSAGETHACNVRDRGELRCWGANGSGQLGLGTTSSFELLPRIVAGDLSPVEIAAGRRHTCALAANDVVRCWGDNAFGQLGNQGTGPASQPTAVFGLSGSVSARRLGAGGNHSCAVRADGTAACWGRSEGGAIGTGVAGDALQPTAVNTSGLTGFQAFISVVGGSNHSCASAHAVFDTRSAFTTPCWGDNRDGQLGISARDIFFTPRYGGVANGFWYRGMSAGAFHTCATEDFQRVKCYGDNGAFQLGDDDVSVDDTLIHLNGATVLNGVQASAGGAHSCALHANGRISCWGGNDFGQLGDGTRNDRAEPGDVGITNAVALSTMRDHNCALLATGVVVCWGRNDFGQASGALNGDRLVPTSIASIAAGEAVGVTTGFQHSCILTVAGRVRCWGRNDEGQLGNNTQTDSATTVEVVRPQKTGTTPLANVVGLVSDAAHNCALRTTGQPFCWGRNPEGQLGDGTRTRRLSAVGVNSFSANIARLAQLAASHRIVDVTALVNCLDGERFSGNVTLTQSSTTGSRQFTGACTGGLSEYRFGVPAQGRDGFAAGEAIADLELVVHSRGDVTDEQRWTRRILIE